MTSDRIKYTETLTVPQNNSKDIIITIPTDLNIKDLFWYPTNINSPNTCSITRKEFIQPFQWRYWFFNAHPTTAVTLQFEVAYEEPIES
ncbi:hypothetical protein UY286_21430 [Paenibacillus polymyxa]|uniref:hypothetical protein n=1 Tax=Paenibacillus polymyxa TaxID=1406 RepID=UPI002AB40265|nr:hypothetical protein [Paenibacillus polymyxa]MDY7993397.1 hypothetical protein [Paenibacillus polymyxa]MDY8120002.1 hypothetical protein [Paenibacillus polymyxa]